MKVFISVIFCTNVVVAPFFVDKDESIVMLENLGRLSGMRRQYVDVPTVSYYQYKGIPFAEPVERFALAEPKRRWVGTHNGKVEGKVCPQPGGNLFYPGQLDEKNCLVLTVSTPINPNNCTVGDLPVLVFFFGGAFIVGTTHTSWYNPERLLREGIVVVQVSYRLGAMGWLTDGEVIPKNLGLKDCRLGLEWVQENVATFGGDPNAVTIYGQSAGAIICDALWQSERTRHLFRAVFLQSGTLINPHSVQKHPERAFQQTVSFSTCRHKLSRPVLEQVECLKSLPDQFLAHSSAFGYVWLDTLQFGSINGLIATVVMEDPADPNAIVTMKPLERLQRGEIPTDKTVMISVTNEERITFEFFRSSLRDKSNTAIVPLGINTTDPEAVGLAIKTYYGKHESGFNNLPRSSLIRISSDIFYNNGLRKFIDLVQPRLENGAGIYCAQFSYASRIGKFNFNELVGHVDDLFYIWGLESISLERLIRPLIPTKAIEKRTQILRMLGNFVKYRNPTPVIDSYLENIVWPKISNLSAVEYLDFNTKLTIQYNPKQENYQFWMNLYDTQGHSTISL